MQRGATGNYIAERISALDIPEERPQSVETADKIRGHLYFEKVVADNGGRRPRWSRDGWPTNSA
ncbi:hypothetical protein ACU686_20900 [Yinghuangia aomiensis]